MLTRKPRSMLLPSALLLCLMMSLAPATAAQGPPACNDDKDNDGDGLIDLDDPGCENKGDKDEFNAAPPVACNDGLDNDGDGRTDDADPGCAGPTDVTETRQFADFRPLPDQVARLEIQAKGDTPQTTKGWRVRAVGDHAYVTTDAAPSALVIFDISDPWHPTRVSSISAGPNGQGRTYEALEVLDYEDRVVVASSVLDVGTRGGLLNGSSGPATFWDVTNPAAPFMLAQVDVLTHMLAAHPESHAVYIAGFNKPAIAGLEGGTLDIIDASDLNNIHLAARIPIPLQAADGSFALNQKLPCHGISVDAPRNRLFCSTVDETLVFDISTPLSPTLQTVIRQLDPHGDWHHGHTYAVPFGDGKFLAVSMEAGGCAQWPSGTQVPWGRLWFYDLRTSPPTHLSSLGFPSPRTGNDCLYAPTEGSELGAGTALLAFGWESAGVVLVDAKDPRDPRILSNDASGGRGRDAFYHRGLVLAAGEKHTLHVAVPIEGTPNPWPRECEREAIVFNMVCKP